MKNTVKRTIAIIFAVIMSLSVLSTVSFATEADETIDAAVVETIEDNQEAALDTAEETAEEVVPVTPVNTTVTQNGIVYVRGESSVGKKTTTKTKTAEEKNYAIDLGDVLEQLFESLFGDLFKLLRKMS